jgi:hypothetical protein
MEKWRGDLVLNNFALPTVPGLVKHDWCCPPQVSSGSRITQQQQCDDTRV